MLKISRIDEIGKFPRFWTLKGGYLLGMPRYAPGFELTTQIVTKVVGIDVSARLENIFKNSEKYKNYKCPKSGIPDFRQMSPKVDKVDFPGRQ